MILPSPLSSPPHSADLLAQASLANPQILVVAHRGVWGAAPENSLAAIRSAIALGVEIVELDVQATADGRLVLMHDETVDRTSTGSGVVAESQYTALRRARLRAGAGDGVETSECIPSLEEALEEARGRICINIDTKYQRDLPAVVRAVRDLDMQDQVVVKANVDPSGRFDIRFEDWFGSIPFMPIFKLRENRFADYLRALSVLKPPMVEVSFLDLSYLAAGRPVAEELGIRIWVNTLDVSYSLDFNDSRALTDPEAIWGMLAEAGVGAIQTDTIIPFLDWRAGWTRRKEQP